MRGTSLAEVLRHFGHAYLREHALSAVQAKAWRAIVSCRTRALGGQRLQCDACGATQWRWNSCRHRCCPQCQTRQREAWRAARMAELLSVPYGHLVFTLPHELNPLAAAHPRWVYDTLMRCAAATLTEFAADPQWLGGIGGFTLVLHTWTQQLIRHPHVHALMPCGALQRVGASKAHDELAGAAVVDGAAKFTWVKPRRGERFLFPVRALSTVFKGKFLAALGQGGARLAHDPAATEAARHQREHALRDKDWVVYAKAPLAGPAAVLDYLSRYTHRTAIGGERLVAIKGDKVLVRVRADHREGKHRDKHRGKRIIAISGVEFLRRLMQHVLPTGFKRIRHYGLLAPAAKAERLAAARQLLAMPQPNAQAHEDAREFMRRVAAIDIATCAHCKRGRWQLVECVAADRSVLAAWLPPAYATPPTRGAVPACRGPPA